MINTISRLFPPAFEDASLCLNIVHDVDRMADEIGGELYIPELF